MAKKCTVKDKWTSPAVILVMHSDIPLMPPHWLSPNHSANVPRPGNQHPIRMVYQSAAELQSRVDRIRWRMPRNTHLHTWINPHRYARTLTHARPHTQTTNLQNKFQFMQFMLAVCFIQHPAAQLTHIVDVPKQSGDLSWSKVSLQSPQPRSFTSNSIPQIAMGLFSLT